LGKKNISRCCPFKYKRITQPAGLEFFRLDPVLDRVVGDEVPDELLMGLVQLAALPLGRPKQLAVVQRVVGNGKPVHNAQRIVTSKAKGDEWLVGSAPACYGSSLG
jgi:hypothetical protein